jgi:hypothetical protein
MDDLARDGAERSTFFVACTLPLALTLAWRSWRSTLAVWISFGLGPRRDMANPPIAARIRRMTTPQTIFRFIP